MMVITWFGLKRDLYSKINNFFIIINKKIEPNPSLSEAYLSIHKRLSLSSVNIDIGRLFITIKEVCKIFVIRMEHSDWSINSLHATIIDDI